MERTRKILFAVILGLFVLCPANISAMEMGNVIVHGFVSQGYLKTTENNFAENSKDGIGEFNEAAINFSIAPIEYLRVGLQVMSRDFGDSGNNKLEFDWVYADYRWRDYLGARVGLIKIPIGFYNQVREIDFLRTSIFLPQGIYSEQYRSMRTASHGVGLYGNIPAGVMGDFDYETVLGVAEGDTSEPLSKTILNYLAITQGGNIADQSVKIDNILASAIRWNTPIEGLRLGISSLSLNAKLSSKSGDTGTELSFTMEYPYFYVASIEYVWHGLKAVAEYSGKHFDGGLDGSSDSLLNMDFDSEAYYGQLTYRFLNRFEIGTSYSVSYWDKDIREDDIGNYRKDTAVSFRWDVLSHMMIKAETHFNEGTYELMPQYNSDPEKNWIIYALKCTINF